MDILLYFTTTITYWGMHYYILRNINNDAFINTSLLTFFLKILLTRLNEIVTCYALEVDINVQLNKKTR